MNMNELYFTKDNNSKLSLKYKVSTAIELRAKITFFMMNKLFLYLFLVLCLTIYPG